MAVSPYPTYKSRTLNAIRLFMPPVQQSAVPSASDLFRPDIRIDGFQHHGDTIETGVLHDKAERIMANITFTRLW